MQQKVLFTNGAFDKASYLIDTPEQLMELARSDYYQHILKQYRAGDAAMKHHLLALIPQGCRRDPEVTAHTMHDLVPSGWLFLDDDRPHTEITAEERHRQVEEHLARHGMSHVPHIALRSASMKYHLLVPMAPKVTTDNSQQTIDSIRMDTHRTAQIVEHCPSSVDENSFPLSSFNFPLKESWDWWQRFFEGILVLDGSTVNVNRLMFFTGEVLTGDESVELLFEASPTTLPKRGLEDSTEKYSMINATTKSAMPASSLSSGEGGGRGFYSIASSIVIQLCGSTAPPEGTRNTTLYEAAKQMAYLDGITEEGMLAAFAPLGYLGLPEREARQCIRSAMRHEKTWLYTLPPELKKSLTPSLSLEEGDSGQEAIKENSPRATYTANPSVTPPWEGPGEAIPQPSTLNPQLEGTQVPELVSLFTSRVPENAREATASMLFAPLASYLNNTVTIRDVSNKVRNLQFTSIVVGNSSSGKGFVDFISDAIMERRRQQDAASWQALKAWEEQKKQVAKGEPAPIKPKVPLYLLTGNMTEPALLERMSTLEPLGGRAYLKVAEIDSLRKMQSTGTRLGGGQEIILAAFDTQRDYGALRVSAEAVSTITTLSLNIVASSTYPGTQEFFRTGCERGTIGRCDVSIVPDSREVPQYGEIDDGFRQQLDHYTDLLMSATGEIICPEADQLIETLRQEYNSPTSPLSYESNPEYYKLCHRQLLITKQKAIVLYICNAYQWDHTWDEWLRHAFYYGMQSKISVFYNEIASWQQRQHTCVMHVSVAPPKSDLEQLPHTFTTQQLRELKRTQAPEAEDKIINKRTRELLRQWVNRSRIIPIEGNSNMWQQV